MFFPNKKIYVFIPENLPLENKGEEAILRGIEDILSQNGASISFYILSKSCKKRCVKDGVIIYPYKWWYSSWESLQFCPQISLFSLYSSALSIFRYALNKFFPKWVSIIPYPIRLLKRLNKSNGSWLRKLYFARYEMLEEIRKNVNVIIAGHDGAFSYREFHILNMFRELGVTYGILGSGSFKFINKQMVEIYKDTLFNCSFLYFREKSSFQHMQKHFPNLENMISLAPDPAFSMKPEEKKNANIIEKENLNSLFSRPVVMLTVTENIMIKRFTFKNKWRTSDRIKEHRYLIANLVQYILDKWNASVIFLPHSIGPTEELNDVRVAKEIIKLVMDNDNRVKIIQNEYNARELKGLIGKADLLIGERIHSLIGAVGVNTPFICLGTKHDSRVNDIIGDMCRCEDCIYDLENPKIEPLCSFADEIWSNRDSLKNRLKEVSLKLHTQLNKIGREIISNIGKDEN